MLYLGIECLNIIKLQNTNIYIKYNSVLITTYQNIYWAATLLSQFSWYSVSTEYQEKQGSSLKKEFLNADVQY